jgi:hypothetical protein
MQVVHKSVVVQFPQNLVASQATQEATSPVLSSGDPLVAAQALATTAVATVLSR